MQAIDRRVIEGYKLWNNNYIAYDILNGSDKYAEKYDQSEVAKFVGYMEHQLATVEPDLDRDELKTAFLEIYANPVVAKENL